MVDKYDTFNTNDFVTGTDRSYRRSIYQVVSQNEDKLILKIICFSGQLYTNVREKNSERLASGFRLATKKELNDELSEALSRHLIDFVKILLRVKRSYLGRR